MTDPIRKITRDQFAHLDLVHKMVVEKLVELGKWELIENESSAEGREFRS
jgi:hypothetical protein